MSFCESLASRAPNQSGVENLDCGGQAGPVDRFLVHVGLDVVGRRALKDVERVFETAGFFDRVLAALAEDDSPVTTSFSSIMCVSGPAMHADDGRWIDLSCEIFAAVAPDP
jgi:hypothetical protein